MSSLSNGKGYGPRFPIHHLSEGRRFGPPGDYDGVNEDKFLANVDAEKCVLGALLIDSARDESRQAIFQTLRPEHFFRETHATIYRAILELADSDSPIDCVILAEHLIQKGLFEQIGEDDYLAELANSVPHSLNGPHHAKIVREKWTLRSLQQATTENIRDIGSHFYNPKEAIQRLAVAIEEIERNELPEEEDVSSFHPWPAPPDEAVWHGVAGQLVRAIEPFTESDPMAILGQILVCLGNLFGRAPYWRYERTRHHLNLFLCMVGATSEARKGSSWNHVLDLMQHVDPDWIMNRVKGGLSTGEGLIHQVRDPVVKTVRDPDNGVISEKELDAGIDDKRVLFVESEFGGLLTMMSRDGYNTSAVIRQAWDGGNLRIANKNTPSQSTGAHVSIIGHITAKELREKLTSTESANGFGNRFVWLCAKRSKILPHGGDVDSLDLSEFIYELQEVKHHVESPLRPDGPIRRTTEANRIWEEQYLRLTSGKSGLVGDLTARAAPQVMRIASIYAVLDRSMHVDVEHLQAALAFWTYCEQSAAWLFGDYVSDPDGQAVVKALHAAADGLTRTQISRKCFKGHKSAEDLNLLLHRLTKDGLIEPPAQTSTEGAVKRGIRWTLKGKNTPDAAHSAR